MSTLDPIIPGGIVSFGSTPVVAIGFALPDDSMAPASGCSYSLDGQNWISLPVGAQFDLSPGRQDLDLDLETDIGLRWVYPERRQDRWEISFRFTEAQRPAFEAFHASVDGQLRPFYLKISQAGGLVIAMYGRKDAGILPRGLSVPTVAIAYVYRLIVLGSIADLEALGMSDLVELTNRVIVLEGQVNDMPGGILDRLDKDHDEDLALIAAALVAYEIPDGSVTAAKVAINAIETNKLVDGAITELKLAALAVTNAKIAVGAISADRIQASAVTNSKLIDGAITAVKIATDAVEQAKIAAGAISADKINAAVQAALGDTPENELQNGGGEEGTLGALPTGWTLGGGASPVVAEDQVRIGARAIKIASAAQDSHCYQDFSVIGGQMYELAGWVKTDPHSVQAGRYALLNLVTTTGLTVIEKTTVGVDPAASEADCGLALDGTARDWTLVRCRFIANASETVRLYLQVGYGSTATATAWFDGVTLSRSHAIYTTDLVAGAVTAAKIAALTITASQIAGNTITAAQIAALTITAAEIAASAITTVKIAAGAVTATEIAGNTITAAQIAALTITAAEIAAGAIVAGKLATDSIVAANIQAGQVTAVKMNVSDLSAISANLGTITAGAIDAVDITSGSITGADIRTAGSGDRVIMDPTFGLRLVDSGDATHVQMNAAIYAGILVNGLRSIDTNDIFLESEDQSVQLFLSEASDRISFVTGSTTRGYFDSNDGSGAGNQPTSLVIRVNGSAQRVNRASSGGFLYI